MSSDSPSRPVAQVTVLLACVLAAVVYSWCAGRVYRAYRFSTRLDQIALKRAIALEPRDASSYDLLGQYLLLDAQDPVAAVSNFKRATELDSYHSGYWQNLARAYGALGADHEQRDALARAAALDPTTPVVAWNAANFFLTQGRVTEALQQFAVVLRNDPSLVTPSLDVCWRALHDVNTIETILPENPDVYLQFVKLLIARSAWNDAHRVWISLLQLNKDFDYHPALFYVNSLLDKGDVTHARAVWQQLSSRSANLSRYHTPNNLVTNAIFAEPILNAGFDWRYSLQPGVSVMLDSTQSHRDNQSLLATFADGQDTGIYEYIPVEPSTQYAVSAWVKSEELESANGPQIAITDAYSNATYALTEETVGTTSWHQVQAVFRTGPAAKLAVIRVMRDPGNTRIHGLFWIDDISIWPTPKGTDE
jgi:Carbohydrate binding domain